MVIKYPRSANMYALKMEKRRTVRPKPVPRLYRNEPQARNSLQALHHVVGSGDLELAGRRDIELLEHAVIADHGIALAAPARAELGGVHLQAGRAGEVAAAVGQHEDV